MSTVFFMDSASCFHSSPSGKLTTCWPSLFWLRRRLASTFRRGKQTKVIFFFIWRTPARGRLSPEGHSFTAFIEKHTDERVSITRVEGVGSETVWFSGVILF